MLGVMSLVPPADDADRDVTGAAVASGICGSAALAFVAAAVHTFATVVAFPPVADVQSVIGTTPGGFDSFLIDALGHWAGRLTVLLASVVFALSGAAVGRAVAA